MLNMPTPISEQLRIIKILSAHVFLLFLKSFHINVPFEMAIANAVIVKDIWSIKASTGWLKKSDFKGCYCRAGVKVSTFVWFMFTKDFSITLKLKSWSDSSSKLSFSTMRNVFILINVCIHFIYLYNYYKLFTFTIIHFWKRFKLESFLAL